MLTFFKDILPKISSYSKKLDEVTLLTNQHWVYVDKNGASKVVYIFRSNSDLLISINGRVEKGKWTYLGNDYLLVENPNESLLYKHGFFDDTVLALKIDGTLDFAFFVNETKIGKELNNIDNILNYLDNRYIAHIYQSTTETKILIYSDELNPICNENSKWGYCNSSGEIIISQKFDSAYKFMGEYAIVIIAEKYGMIDKNENFIIEPIYEYLEPFYEGLALARLNRKFGFIDKENTVCIDFIYDDADSFIFGKAKVKINDKVSFLAR
jgi:hypothetical protein